MDLDYGLRKLYRPLEQTLSAKVVDRALGVETAEMVQLAEVGLDAPDRVHYQPAGWLDLPRILRRDEVTADDVFLDLGCGKGRAVLMAARYPFRRVIGVELSERLLAVAQANVAASRARRRCGEVELHRADAVDYRIPDDVTVVYMFNPFGGAIFDAAIGHLIESVDRRPRTVRLIYRNAVHHDRLLSTGRVELVRRALPPRPNREWRRAVSLRLYVIGPADHRLEEHQAA
jgi:SAM-dependent methyltransferase